MVDAVGWNSACDAGVASFLWPHLKSAFQLGSNIMSWNCSIMKVFYWYFIVAFSELWYYLPIFFFAISWCSCLIDLLAVFLSPHPSFSLSFARSVHSVCDFPSSFVLFSLELVHWLLKLKQIVFCLQLGESIDSWCPKSAFWWEHRSWIINYKYWLIYFGKMIFFHVSWFNAALSFRWLCLKKWLLQYVLLSVVHLFDQQSHDHVLDILWILCFPRSVSVSQLPRVVFSHWNSFWVLEFLDAASMQIWMESMCISPGDILYSK